MIQIDKTDFLYKTLQKLGVEEQEIEGKYIEFASVGIATLKDFNNHIQSSLGLDYVGEFDENILEEVVDYYSDLKNNKSPSKSKVSGLLKEYKQNQNNQARKDVINSQLKDVLFIACTYKLRHVDINLSDLVQICNMGLMIAVDKFDIDAKLAFETYLNYWILDVINKEFTQGEKNG